MGKPTGFLEFPRELDSHDAVGRLIEVQRLESPVPVPLLRERCRPSGQHVLPERRQPQRHPLRLDINQADERDIRIQDGIHVVSGQALDDRHPLSTHGRTSFRLIGRPAPFSRMRFAACIRSICLWGEAQTAAHSCPPT